jgi:hypothetical protein
MNLLEKLVDDAFEIGWEAGCGSLESRRKKPRNLVDRDSAGKLSRHRAPHTIAHREDKIGALGRSVAELSKVAELKGVELKAEERILIVGANFAPVRQSEPLKMSRYYALSVHDPVLRNLEESLKTRSLSSRSGHRTGDK